MKIALLGAESTGKTQLATALAQALRERGHSVCLVAEHLRDWVEQHGRVPLQSEQLAIAQEQARRVNASDAAQIAGWAFTIADTTPLMTAVYSHKLFADRSLYPMALSHQASYPITLLMGLDIAWVADGLQRDGPQVREPVDALLRQALDAAALPYHVVYGSGPARLQAALQALEGAMQTPYDGAADATKKIAVNALFTSPAGQNTSENMAWKWVCDKCSDPQCEHRLFSQLLIAEPRSAATAHPAQ